MKNIKKIKKLSKVFAISSLSIMGIIFGHHKFNPKIKIIKSLDGKIEYRHPDERTTRYLNIISGKEKFKEEDLLISEKDSINSIFKKNDLYVENFNRLTLNDIDSLLSFSIKYSVIKRGEYINNFKKRLDKLNEFLPEKNSDSLYKLFWELHHECGNPKIRLVSENSLLIPYPSYKKNGFYNPFSKTIYLNIQDFYKNKENFVIENSHSKQFKDKPIRSYLKFFRDCLIVTKKSFERMPEVFEGEYNNLYNQEGTFENDAHNKIAPQLMEKYPIIKKKK